MLERRNSIEAQLQEYPLSAIGTDEIIPLVREKENASIWSSLSSEQLMEIVFHCDKLGEVDDVMDEIILPNIIQEKTYTKWKKRVAKRHKNILKTYGITHSLFSSLNDAPSFTIMTLLSIISITTLSVLALSIFTGLLAGAMILAGIVYFVAGYREKQDELNAERKFFLFAEAKTEALNELLRRQNPERANDPEFNFRPEEGFVYRNKDVFAKLKPAVGAGLLTASVLFGTYYLCASTIVAAIGVTAVAGAMAGPIGLGVALGVAVVIGAIYAYKVYQTALNEDKSEKLKKHINKQYKAKARLFEKSLDNNNPGVSHQTNLTRKQHTHQLTNTSNAVNQSKTMSLFRRRAPNTAKMSENKKVKNNR